MPLSFTMQLSVYKSPGYQNALFLPRFCRQLDHPSRPFTTLPWLIQLFSCAFVPSPLASAIIFLSFLWIILLCLCLFGQWDLMNHLQRSLLLVMLLIDTITVVMLPMLLLVPFRPWLDAARLFFLAVSHFGIAILFVVKSSSFQCIASNADQEAICNLIILYVSVSCWFVPTLIVGYSCGLALLVYRLSKIEPSASIVDEDLEKQSSTRTRTSETLTKPNHASVQLDNYHWAI